MIPSAFGTSLITAIANHLWQSTLFAVAAGLLALALRKDQARARYWLWLTASLKFLLPFSLLITIGSHLSRPASGTVALSGISGIYVAMNVVGQPFTPHAAVPVATASNNHASLLPLLPLTFATIWLCGSLAVLWLWLARWSRISRLAQQASPQHEGREVDALRRVETAVGIRSPLMLRLSNDTLEPGIFGIIRPILLWPAKISGHLEDAHLETILAHELGHVRRRDNLASAAHMLVEAIFWFHPIVWWLGTRLVEERERACDEEVLQWGNQPHIYAESILKTCEFCVESSLPCVAGVTGADLKKRIVHIMSNRSKARLNFGKKFLLTTAAMLTVAAPLLFGVVHAADASAGLPGIDEQALISDKPLPSFEVASIKPSDPDYHGIDIQISPGRLMIRGATPRVLIQFAYKLKSENQVTDGPAWLDSKHYDIDAKEEQSQQAADHGQMTAEQGQRIRLELQSLLAERFHLQVSPQTKELPVYALIVAKGGPKLTPTPAPKANDKPHGQMIHMNGRGDLTATDVPVSLLADVLSRQPETNGRVVVDKTGLTGNYSWNLKWTPESPDGPSSGTPTDDAAPSFFTALEEQLGLKLDSQKGPVAVVAVDRMELPSVN